MSALEYIQKLDELESEFISNKKRLSKLESEFVQTKRDLIEHKRVLAKEQKDVENLDKAKISHIFIRIVGKMQEKIEKEELELLQAKVKFDELTNAVQKLDKSVVEIQNHLSFLKIEITKTREDGARLYGEIRDRNLQKNNSIIEKKAELIELDQAIKAGNTVLAALDDTLGDLRSAEGWSTWDTFGGGGIFSDMMKYEKMDHAQAAMNQLSQSIRLFRTELKDVEIDVPLEFKGVSMGTKTFDIFFDNIFTDWSVRSKIQENIQQLNGLDDYVLPILTKLKDRKIKVQTELGEIDIN